MNKIEFINLRNKKKWQNLINYNEINPGQTWEYSKFELLNTGINTVLLKLTIKKKKYFCPFHLIKENKFSKIYSLRGFSGFNQNLKIFEMQIFKKELEKIKIKNIYFTSNPYLKKKAEINKFGKFKHNVYLINLSQKINLIFNNFSNNLKRNIKKIEKRSDLKTIVGNTIVFKNILELYKENLKRINLRANNLYNYKSLKFLIKNKNNLIIQSKVQNQIVALSIFLLTKKNAYYLTHFSTNKFNFLSSWHIYEAIKNLKSKKIKLLNLGGPVINRPGVERFKLSFNPIIKNLAEYRW